MRRCWEDSKGRVRRVKEANFRAIWRLFIANVRFKEGERKLQKRLEEEPQKDHPCN